MPEDLSGALLDALSADLLPPWLSTVLAVPRVGLAFLMLAVAGVLVFSTRSHVSTLPGKREQEADVERPTNTHWLRRLWWHIHPPHDVMAIDGLVLDRSRKPHCAWLGPTGAGKSSAVAVVRLDGARPTLCAMPDLSDPIRDAATRLNGFVWTACVSTADPVNFLIGTPTEVAERLTEVFRSGGTGAWKRAARRMTSQVIREMDAEGEPRYLHVIGERLREKVSKDKNLSLVCAGWVDRFLDLADQFGDSISPYGVDLAVLMRRGKTAVLDNDAFDHPALGGDVVALGLAEAKRIASLVPGGFRLVFEEAGQLGERIDLAEPFHRAGRRRRISVDDLTQAESDLTEGISANIGTRVYFSQELKPLQRVAADRLGLEYRQLDPANMRDFTAWIAHGRIRRLVRFTKPAAPGRPSRREEKPGVMNYQPGGMRVVERMDPDPEAGWRVVPELGAKANGHYALPGAKAEAPSYVKGRERRFQIWSRLSGTWNKQGCHLWTGGLNKGYGKVSYLNVSGWETHFLFWAWKVMEYQEEGHEGSDLEVFYVRHPEVPRFVWPESGDELVTLRALKKWMGEQLEVKKLSIDHNCPGAPNTLCGNTRHLWLATGTENSKWRHERRKGDGRLRVEAMGQ